MSELPPSDDARESIDPRTRALLMAFRRALLMMVAALEEYLGIAKQLTTQ